MESSSTLPSDVLFEIFSRTSLKTIGRSRLVSKDLNLATYESSFVQAFRQRTKTISGFFTQTLFSNKPTSQQFVSTTNLGTDSSLSLKFLPCRHVNIKAATKQGILLCVNESDTRRRKIPEYYVCKPSTKEWHQIPNPRTRYYTERVGMMVLRSEPLCYKIVRFSQPKSPCIKYKSILYNVLHCEIFSSEKWAWKRLEDVLLPCSEFLSFEPAVSACGALNWIMSNNEIFTFFVDTESSTMFDLPFPLCKKYYFKHMKLVEYSGRLAMLCIEDSSMQLWVLEDYDTKIWSKRPTISLKAVQGVESYTSPLSLDSSDILVITVYRWVAASNQVFLVLWAEILHLCSLQRPFDLFLAFGRLICYWCLDCNVFFPGCTPFGELFPLV
ncbi:F-box protein At5g07610-like [Alnus glutinosa]|uniref:F-box protein At5g07610-like n=1 Tax=Alnus glutinosa TaxID=3517 RepID=UPI002D79A78A|nr:F-box protein At5g07610-like [Alnus glutinosa]